MDLVFTTVALPIALGIVMLGLGLGLTRQDFERVAKQPSVAVAALVCQVLVLPAICFALILAFALPPELAVGMMLLAAAPGGTTANLISHLFRGDVALNISLTAVNSVISVITLPIVVNLSVSHFLAQSDRMGTQLDIALQTFVIVLLPVLVGMTIRWRRPRWAQRMDRPVRVASLGILIVVLIGAIATNWDLLTSEFGTLSLIAVVFCLLSLSVGFLVPRWFGAQHRQAIATSFEIGLHNATLAIVVARTVLNSVEASLPAAVYAVVMLPLAVAFGTLVRARSRTWTEPAT